MTGRTTNRTMSRPEFFRLCEELRNQREKLTTECPPPKKCIAFLQERLKFKITDQALREAKEATGIEWNIRKNTASNEQKRNRTRVLARAILRLYKELGLSRTAIPELDALIVEYEVMEGGTHTVPQHLLHPSQTFNNQQEQGKPSNHSQPPPLTGTTRLDVNVVPPRR